MGISALSRHLLDDDDDDGGGAGGGNGGVADSLRLLLAALHRVEGDGGYWHGSIAGTVQRLKAWDEKRGGFQMGQWGGDGGREGMRGRCRPYSQGLAGMR